MVAIPEGTRPGLFGEIAERISNELDCGGGIGDEYEVVVVRVCTEEVECFETDGVDHLARNLGWMVCRVGVSVEIGCEEGGEAVYEGERVDGCAAVVEVDSLKVVSLGK